MPDVSLPPGRYLVAVVEDPDAAGKMLMRVTGLPDGASESEWPLIGQTFNLSLTEYKPPPAAQPVASKKEESASGKKY